MSRTGRGRFVWWAGCLAPCLFFSPLTLSGQATREFRGLWIATVFNTDWPSQTSLSGEQQKEELVSLIQQAHAWGMNAIIFQVRPSGDAMYLSPYEPWSEWLSGQQGVGPSPFFDPLQVAVETCHQYGMELHAWVNPFRAVVRQGIERPMSPYHVAFKHPDWLLTYGDNQYLDPGIPAARDYVRDIIKDIVYRYEIDAIHIDDYFYPYALPGVAFPDTNSYALFGRSFANKADWRRANIDQFIFDLNRDIKRLKPTVELGISPFGVWRNQADDPRGSPTRAGQTSFDHLFADVRKWLSSGWIDYVAPQIYFSIGYPPAAYDVLVDWWSQNDFGRHVYIGKAIYKVGNNQDENWNDPAQIARQLLLDENYPQIKGSIYFNARALLRNPLGVLDTIKGQYSVPALPPDMAWMGVRAPEAPQLLEGAVLKKGILLSWEHEGAPAFFNIYRAYSSKREASTLRFELLATLPGKVSTWLDREINQKGFYHYKVRAMEKGAVEGPETRTFSLKVKKKHLRQRQ